MSNGFQILAYSFDLSKHSHPCADLATSLDVHICYRWTITIVGVTDAVIIQQKMESIYLFYKKKVNWSFKILLERTYFSLMFCLLPGTSVILCKITALVLKHSEVN